MLGSKLDLFKKEWLDVVFENRNKEYGAYALRKYGPKATNIALFSVSAVVLFFVAIKAFDIKIFPDPPVEETQVVTPVTLEDLEIPEIEEEEEEPLPQEEEPPQRIAEEPPAQDLIRFPEPKVVDARDVKEEIVSQEEIEEKNATPARITLKGTPGASGVPTGEFGPKKVEGAITGSTQGDPNSDNQIYDFEAVEVPASYPGGINAFRQFVANMQYPQAAIDAGVSGTIELSFVIDRSGNVSDIKVVRDLSYGTGQAAINRLKQSKKWQPAVQNGRPVPVRYSLPIKLNLSGM